MAACSLITIFRSGLGDETRSGEESSLEDSEIQVLLLGVSFDNIKGGEVGGLF